MVKTAFGNVCYGSVNFGLEPQVSNSATCWHGAGLHKAAIEQAKTVSTQNDRLYWVDCWALRVMTVHTAGSNEKIEGQTVGLKFDISSLHVFDAGD